MIRVMYSKSLHESTYHNELAIIKYHKNWGIYMNPPKTIMFSTVRYYNSIRTLALKNNWVYGFNYIKFNKGLYRWR